MNANNEHTLYKVLNEQRTQGEWDTFLHDGYVRNGGMNLGNFNSMMVSKKTTEANAEYTALAVNNLHHLAEALQNFIDDDKESGWGYKAEHIIQATEALKRIS